MEGGSQDPSLHLPPASGLLSRRNLLRAAGAVALGTAAGTAAHGFLYERHHIEVTEQTLDVAGWPSALSGLRIGFLTDLHRSSTVSHEMIAHAVDLVMARQPDLIVVGGRPIREPLAWAGPFVMNSRAEVVKAFEDFQRGMFGHIPT